MAKRTKLTERKAEVISETFSQCCFSPPIIRQYAIMRWALSGLNTLLNQEAKSSIYAACVFVCTWVYGNAMEWLGRAQTIEKKKIQNKSRKRTTENELVMNALFLIFLCVVKDSVPQSHGVHEVVNSYITPCPRTFEPLASTGVCLFLRWNCFQ